ncbi:MAG: OpgC family protein, partial [Rubrimonas sp.]
MTKRSESIDFWRGLILVFIFINHVPGNPLEAATHRNYGWSDAAEAFVFISGLALAMAWGRLADRPAELRRRAFARAGYLYRVQLALAAAAVLVAWVGFAVTGLEAVRDMHGRALFFADPALAVAGLLSMSYQIGYFNILPLYVVLIAGGPLALMGAARAPAATLAVSIAIYGAARLGGLSLPGAQGAGWFFNPFAWQLLFVIGVIVGTLWREGPPRSPTLAALAAGVVAFALAARTDVAGLAPGLGEWVGPRLDGHKPQLGLARLLHFLALAYLLAILGVARPVLDSAVGRTITAMGRAALPVFCVGSVLAAIGQVLTIAADRTGAAPAELVGLAWVCLGIMMLIVTPALSRGW